MNQKKSVRSFGRNLLELQNFMQRNFLSDARRVACQKGVMLTVGDHSYIT